VVQRYREAAEAESRSIGQLCSAELDSLRASAQLHKVFVFFFTLLTGPRRSVSLKPSDTRVCEPQIRARLSTKAHFCEVVVLKLLRKVPLRLPRVPRFSTCHACFFSVQIPDFCERKPGPSELVSPNSLRKSQKVARCLSSGDLVLPIW